VIRTPPLLAWGIGALPRPGTDTFARRELAEHVAVLCRDLHGTRPGGRCLWCAALLREAS
jgi:hypothetical protein